MDGTLSSRSFRPRSSSTQGTPSTTGYARRQAKQAKIPGRSSSSLRQRGQTSNPRTRGSHGLGSLDDMLQPPKGAPITHHPALPHALETLYRSHLSRASTAGDPLHFVHRYATPEDQEIAALFAAGFSFGAVKLFFPVLEGLSAWFDAQGGPRAAVAQWDPSQASELDHITYRWIRSHDVAAVLGALNQRLKPSAGLTSLLGPPGEFPRVQLAHLRQELLSQLSGPATRGTGYLLSNPLSGSAAKRWMMFLRWMVRPRTEGIDLGLWTHLSPAQLHIPLDVHVARIARLIGLTQRKDATWKTVEEVTTALRTIDPDDPVRFDFALAHLGIGYGCRGSFQESTCPRCLLRTPCALGPSDR